MTASSPNVVDTTRTPLSVVPERLVVGVDGSEASLRALDTATMVARRNGTAVTVAYVRQPSLFAGAVAVDWSAVYASVEADVTEAARERLDGLRWRLVVADGMPAPELERIAHEEGADLLVVGRSQGGHIHRLIEGSVGGHAATHAPVPVLVVR